MKKINFISIFLFVFSFINLTQIIKASSISGKIYSTNNYALKGIKVELRNYSAKDVKNQFFWEGKAKLDNTYSNSNGEYEFNYLPDGDYYLTIEFPQKMEKVYEYVQKPAAPIKLTQKQNIKDADFEMKQTLAIISGRIYKRNAVTPYPNVSLELSCNGKTYYSTVTDEKGEYMFVSEPSAGQWQIIIKDINKTITLPLNLDLSKADTFENVNINSTE
ncbi:MAG: carboxypeptidase-like regulatory domain-containing protein [bacterium]